MARQAAADVRQQQLHDELQKNAADMHEFVRASQARGEVLANALAEEEARQYREEAEWGAWIKARL